MNEPVNVALIGLGRMGKIYARTIDRMNDARLTAVASLDIDDQQQMLSEIDVAHQFKSADAAFELEAVDAVIIATPTSTHADFVIRAASAGKAIFCEKPLALSLEDTRRMLDAVDQADVPLQVGFMRRFDERFASAKSTIASGRIGRPITFKGVGRDPFCPDPTYADPRHSGGLIMDMAIHDFDLARWLLASEVVRVSAEGTNLVCDELRAVGDFDNAVVNLRFATGAIGSVEVSRNASYGYDIRAEVLGSRSAVRVGHADYGTRPQPRPVDHGEHYLTHRFGPAYRKQIRHFVDCVRRGIEPKPSGRDALAAFEIALAATYAAATGGPVTLEAIRTGWTPT
ncbi:MAG: Gfo/Idh/MocA family oxidoreductase [Rhodothermales bacterium]